MHHPVWLSPRSLLSSADQGSGDPMTPIPSIPGSSGHSASSGERVTTQTGEPRPPAADAFGQGEGSARAVTACSPDARAVSAPDAGGAPTASIAPDLAKAAWCLAQSEKVQDPALQRCLDDRHQLELFSRETARPFLHRRPRLPMPDIVGDSPALFVLKCLAIDAITMEWAEGMSCTFFCLEQALATRNLPATWRILQGMRLALQQGHRLRTVLTDRDGYTLLHRPFLYKSLSAGWLRLVLASGILDAGRPDSNGMTPLNWAIFLAPDADAVCALLEAGANPNRGDPNGPHPLILCTNPAVEQGMEKMEALLRHKAIDPNSAASCDPFFAVTPLHWAVATGSITAVRRLLAHPAIDPNRVCPRGPGSPLAVAASHFLDRWEDCSAIIRALAAAGGRLVLWFPENKLVSCGSDVAWLQQQRGAMAVGGEAQARERQLQALIDSALADKDSARQDAGTPT